MPVPLSPAIVKQLHGAGLHLVLARGKRALGNKWQKNPASLEAALKHIKTPNATLGWMPGKSGLWILDADKYAGETFADCTDADIADAILDIVHTVGEPIAACRSAGTSLGWHGIYKMDPNDNTGSPAFSFGLVSGEIRCNSGQVIIYDPSAPLAAIANAENHEPTHTDRATKADQGPPQRIVDQLADNSPRTYKQTPLDIDDISRIIQNLDLNDYNDWIECGMAIHHATQGHAEGLELWDKHSAEFSKNYEAGACEKHWKSFGDSKKPLTMATMIKRANERRTAAGKPKILLTNIADPHDSDGTDKILDTSDSGVADGLRQLGVEIFFNRRSGTEEVLILPEGKQLFGRSGFEIHTKRLDSRLRSELRRNFSAFKKDKNGKLVNAPYWLADNHWRAAIGSLQDQNQRDPFAEWLETTAPQWDGKLRLDALAGNLWKTESPFAKWFGCYIFLLPVLRTYGPYKSDEIPILQGLQGCGKSYFFENMLPNHLNNLFFGNLSFNQRISAKERLEKIIGKAIAIWSECAGTRFSELEQIKDFVTTVHDVHRFNYERTPVTLWRTAAIAATTNASRPIPYDETGSRRFVVLNVEREPGITAEEAEEYIAAHKLQWWAEACHRAKDGDRPNLPNELKTRQSELNPKFENRDVDRDEYIENLFLDTINEHEDGETKNAVSTVALLNKISPVDKEEPAPFRGMSSRAVAGILENLTGADEDGGNPWRVIRDDKKLECPVTGKRNYLFRKVFLADSVQIGQSGQQSGQKKPAKKPPEFKRLPFQCPLVHFVQYNKEIEKVSNKEGNKKERGKIKVPKEPGQLDKVDKVDRRMNGAAKKIIKQAIDDYNADDDPTDAAHW